MLPAKARADWYKTWMTTDEGKKAVADMQRDSTAHPMQWISVHADGTFRIDDVAPGEYGIAIPVQTPTENLGGKTLGNFSGKVTVPPVTPADLDTPIDVGTLTMAPVGEPGHEPMATPDVAVKTTDGTDWKLSAQKDKVVLTYFWSITQDETASHLAAFKALWAAEGKDPNFSMIGLAIDEDSAAVGKYAHDHGIDWPVAALPTQAARELLNWFDRDGFPAAWVTGADGKVAARDLTVEKMQAAVEKALKK